MQSGAIPHWDTVYESVQIPSDFYFPSHQIRDDSLANESVGAPAAARQINGLNSEPHLKKSC